MDSTKLIVDSPVSASPGGDPEITAGGRRLWLSAAALALLIGGIASAVLWRPHEGGYGPLVTVLKDPSLGPTGIVVAWVPLWAVACVAAATTTLYASYALREPTSRFTRLFVLTVVVWVLQVTTSTGIHTMYGRADQSFWSDISEGARFYVARPTSVVLEWWPLALMLLALIAVPIVDRRWRRRKG